MGQHAADRLVNDEGLNRLRQSVGQSVDHDIPKFNVAMGFRRTPSPPSNEEATLPVAFFPFVRGSLRCAR